MYSSDLADASFNANNYSLALNLSSCHRFLVRAVIGNADQKDVVDGF